MATSAQTLVHPLRPLQQTVEPCNIEAGHYHSHRSNLVRINCVRDLHLRTSAALLTMCTLNVRSIANKSAMFVDYINECKADLFAITETWLSDNDSAVCYEITPPGYKVFHCPRSDRRSGGTALLFKDNINVCKLESGSRISFEFSEYLVCTLVPYAFDL